MSTCLIRQPAGLGDIFFTQKIAKNMLDKKICDQVIWPVISQYNYLNDYIGSGNISFIDETNDFPYKNIYTSSGNTILKTNEYIYVPLQHADQHYANEKVMQVKYKFCGNISYDNWEDYFEIKRNYEREKYLIDYLGVNLDEPFILSNNNFGSKNYKHLNNKREFDLPKGIKIINMEYLSFDNFFDWMPIFEKAKEIHTVDTAICYLLHKMKINNVTVYSRTKDPNFFSYVDDIFNKEWRYIL